MLDHSTNEHIGWTDERTALLKKRWTEGASATQIASELGGGVTRNGVIGKVSRLHLPSHGASPGKRKMAKRNPEQIAADSRQRNKLRHGNAGQPKAAAIVHRVEMATIKPPRILPVPKGLPELSQRKRLVDVGASECHWCEGDPLTADHSFCGLPAKEGSSWCDTHHKRVFLKL